MEHILEMKNIKKSFSGVNALKGVDLCIRPGEAHALVGENGAGKSTLIKILTGVYSKSSGNIYFDGKEIDPKTPFDAQALGISPIYQELNLIPDLTVAENVFLGHAPRGKNGLMDWKKMFSETQSIMESLGIDVDVRAQVHTLGTAVQHMVAIVRAIQLECRLIVMDEPTSSLDKKEVSSLMDMIRELKKKGIAVLFISHRLDEIFEICERVTILKDGECVGTYDVDQITQHEMVCKMLGRDFVKRERIRAARCFEEGDYIFEMEHIAWFPKISEMNLRIHRGEILGLAGLLGSGRTETAKILFGYTRPDRGIIKKEGKEIRIRTTREAVGLHMAMCPEERRSEGIIPNMSVRDNIMLAALSEKSRFGITFESVKNRLAEEYIRKFSIKTPSPGQLIKNLSGGNQQKVILARWLATDPQLVILDEPTRGIDVGAKGAIEELIQQFAQQGISVLYISSEIDELVNNCDRILVMREGRQVAELTAEEISRDAVMDAIARSGGKGGA